MDCQIAFKSCRRLCKGGKQLSAHSITYSNCNLFGYGQRGENHFDERDEVELTDNIRRATWQYITENGELQNRDTISAKLEAAITPGIFNKLKVGWKIAREKNFMSKMQRGVA